MANMNIPFDFVSHIASILYYHQFRSRFYVVVRDGLLRTLIKSMSPLQHSVTGASQAGGHVVGGASDALVRASMCLLNGCNAELCAKLA